MPVSVDSYDASLHAIYDAAINPGRWGSVVHCIKELVEAHTGQIVLVDRLTGGGKAVYAEADPFFIERYDSYYATINTPGQRLAKVPDGKPVTLEMVLAPEEFLPSEIYQDFYRPMGVRYMAGIGISSGRGRVTTFSFARPLGAEPFDASTLDVLRRLEPHIRRASLVSQTLVFGPQDDFSDTLFDSGPAKLIVDGAARILFANVSAERILAANDGLYSERGLLCAANATQANILRQAVRAAAQSSFESPSSGLLAVGRPSGKAAYAVLVMPLPRRPGWAGGPKAYVLMADPAASAQLLTAMLNTLYGLTRMEARVAVRSLEPESLAGVAKALSIAPTTVKTHMQAALAKTGTRSRLELALLVERLRPLAEEYGVGSR